MFYILTDKHSVALSSVNVSCW